MAYKLIKMAGGNSAIQTYAREDKTTQTLSTQKTIAVLRNGSASTRIIKVHINSTAPVTINTCDPIKCGPVVPMGVSFKSSMPEGADSAEVLKAAKAALALFEANLNSAFNKNVDEISVA